jgi:hypothetical protein
MNQTIEEVLPRLLKAVGQLYEETADLTEGDGELQPWYNRGYADGMIKAMKCLGYDQEVYGTLIPKDEPVAGGGLFLPWGKAYRHGFEMGEKETREVLVPIAHPVEHSGGNHGSS